jgi:hypothetical protein
MKHILNNLTEEEKKSIREQHTGGMNVITENFSKLMSSKLGDSKPLVSEQNVQQPTTQEAPLPLCSQFKNYIDNNLGNFYSSWDASGNMILTAAVNKQISFAPNNPMVQDKPFCKCCVK